MSSPPLAWTEAPICAERLYRALALRVVRDASERESGTWRVESATEPDMHWVQLDRLDEPVCDCGDHVFREGLCKHALAVLIDEANPRTMAELAHLIRRAKRSGRLILQITDRPIRPVTPAHTGLT